LSTSTKNVRAGQIVPWRPRSTFATLPPLSLIYINRVMHYALHVFRIVHSSLLFRAILVFSSIPPNLFAFAFLSEWRPSMRLLPAMSSPARKSSRWSALSVTPPKKVPVTSKVSALYYYYYFSLLMPFFQTRHGFLRLRVIIVSIHVCYV